MGDGNGLTSSSNLYNFILQFTLINLNILCDRESLILEKFLKRCTCLTCSLSFLTGIDETLKERSTIPIISWSQQIIFLNK